MIVQHATLTHTIICEHQEPGRAKAIVEAVDISADLAALSLDGVTLGTDVTTLAVVGGKQTITRTVCLNLDDGFVFRYATEAAMIGRLHHCLEGHIGTGSCSSVTTEIVMAPGACV